MYINDRTTTKSLALIAVCLLATIVGLATTADAHGQAAQPAAGTDATAVSVFVTSGGSAPDQD